MPRRARTPEQREAARQRTLAMWGRRYEAGEYPRPRDGGRAYNCGRADAAAGRIPAHPDGDYARGWSAVCWEGIVARAKARGEKVVDGRLFAGLSTVDDRPAAYGVLHKRGRYRKDVDRVAGFRRVWGRACAIAERSGSWEGW